MEREVKLAMVDQDAATKRTRPCMRPVDKVELILRKALIF